MGSKLLQCLLQKVLLTCEQSSVLACHVKLHLHLIRDVANLKESIIDTEWLAANGY